MKSNGTVVYITKKCVKMGWHMGTQQTVNFTNACCRPSRYVPYKGTFVPYDGTFGTSDQGQMLDM
jgi:hypothetical protein